jgi:hypothetical protein
MALRTSLLSLLIALSLSLAACGASDPNKAKTEALTHAVKAAKKLFERTQTDPMANASFYSVAQMGGTGIHYLVASLPDRDNNPDTIVCYEENKPARPWCVVVKPGPGELEITIDGFGAQLDKPLLSETAKLGAYKRF